MRGTAILREYSIIPAAIATFIGGYVESPNLFGISDGGGCLVVYAVFIGFVLSSSGEGAMLLNMAVFGAASSYVLMMVGHIGLRVREPAIPRPYRTPGGVVTTGSTLVVACVAVSATFLVDPVAAGWTSAVFCAFMLFFALYSRTRLVAGSPDEESTVAARAEKELE